MTSRRTKKSALRMLLAGVASAALALSGAVSAAAADAPTATISGHVTREDGGEPVSGLGVFVTPTAGGFSYNGYTDASGAYIVVGLPDGEYLVRFAAEGTGLMSEFWEGAFDPWDATPVAVGAGEALAGIDASLQQGGSITGHVTRESDGAPLQGVAVTANRSGGTGSGSAFTDEDGGYEITGLRAGDYTVAFDSADDGLADEYWDAAFRIGDASLVSVGAGATTASIDASLVRTAVISGTVTAEDGGSPVSGFVEVSPAGELGSVSVAIEADGRYSVSVIPGTYTVRFRASDDRLLSEYWDDALTLSEATPITVADGEQRASVDAQLAAATAISGTVTANGLPIEGSSVFALVDGQPVGIASTDADGAYELVLPSGAYVLVVRAPLSQPVYATQYYLNAAAPSGATPVILGATADVTGVDFDLAFGADIRGTVALENGDVSSGEGAAVVAYRWGVDGWEEIERTPSWGAFSFSPDSAVDGGILPAGVYTIAVEYPGYCTQFVGETSEIDEAESFDLVAGEVIDGIDVTLTTDCPAPKPRISVGAASVSAGGEIVVTGENFTPGETVSFELHSDPIALGSLVADGGGRLSGSLRIPATAPVGAHTLVAVGAQSAVEAGVSLQITAAASGSLPGTGSQGGSSSGTGAAAALASTGAELPEGALIAGLFLLMGGAVLLRRRAIRP